MEKTSDPLNPKPVRPLERTGERCAEPDSTEPPWIRLLESIRPTVEIEKIKRTGEVAATIGIKGQIEF